MALYTDEDVGLAPKGPSIFTDAEVGLTEAPPSAAAVAPPTEPERSWFEKQKVSPETVGKAFMAGLQSGIGAVLQGAGAINELAGSATITGAVRQAMKPQGPAIDMPILTKTAVENLQGISEHPAVKVGEAIAQDAATRWPIPEKEREALLTKGAEMAGGFVPLIASGPLGPLTIGLQSVGSHISNDFAEGIKNGMDPETAARSTIKKALASGITQAAIWTFAPHPMRQAVDKYFIDRLGLEGAKRFVAGRGANVLEGFALGTLSVGAENVVSGKPITQDIVAGGAGMAAPMIFMPRGKTRQEAVLGAMGFGSEDQRAIREAIASRQKYPFGEPEFPDILPPPPEKPPVIPPPAPPAAPLVIFRPSPPAPVVPPTVTPTIEKGEENAAVTRIEQTSGQPEYTGVARRENLPPYPPEIRQEESQRPSGGNRPVGGGLVAPEAPKGEPKIVKPPKPSWQMTQAEYNAFEPKIDLMVGGSEQADWYNERVRLSGKPSAAELLEAEKRYGIENLNHYFAVRGALREKLPVPDEAIAPYPDLVKEKSAKPSEVSFQPPKYTYKLPSGLKSDAELKAAFDEQRAAMAQHEADVATWEQAQPQNARLIFKDADRNFFQAAVPDPQGGWRVAKFTQMYRDEPDSVAPWGHDRYATRLEAIRNIIRSGNVERVETLPRILTEQELKELADRKNAEAQAKEVIPNAKEERLQGPQEVVPPAELPPAKSGVTVPPAGSGASQPLTVRTAAEGQGAEASSPRSNEAQTGAEMTVGGLVPRSAAELAKLLQRAKTVETKAKAQYNLKKDQGNKTVNAELRFKWRQAKLKVQELRNQLKAQKRIEEGPKEVTVKGERTADVGSERPPDIIDDFRGTIGKKLSLESAKQFIEDIEERLKAYPVLRKIFTREGGLAMDDALDGFHREGMHMGITSETDFIEALIGAAAARKGAKGKAFEKTKGETADMAKRLDFEEAAFQPRPTSVKDGIAVSTLYEGEKFELRGVKCVVKSLIVDEETGEVSWVEIEDGRRFGTQKIPNTEDAYIFPDKGTLEKKEPNVEDIWNVEEPPPAKAAEAPAAPAEQPPVEGVREGGTGKTPEPARPSGNVDLFGNPIEEPKPVAPVAPEAPAAQQGGLGLELEQKPAVERRPLTPKEQDEFQQLAIALKKYREGTGEKPTSEQVRRYEYLIQLAGQETLGFAAPTGKDALTAELKSLTIQLAEMQAKPPRGREKRLRWQSDQWDLERRIRNIRDKLTEGEGDILFRLPPVERASGYFGVREFRVRQMTDNEVRERYADPEERLRVMRKGGTKPFVAETRLVEYEDQAGTKLQDAGEWYQDGLGKTKEAAIADARKAVRRDWDKVPEQKPPEPPKPKPLPKVEPIAQVGEMVLLPNGQKSEVTATLPNGALEIWDKRWGTRIVQYEGGIKRIDEPAPVRPDAITRSDKYVEQYEAKVGKESPDAIRLLQEIGNAIDDRLRLGDMEEIGRAYVALKRGDATVEQFNNLLHDRERSLGLTLKSIEEAPKSPPPPKVEAPPVIPKPTGAPVGTVVYRSGYTWEKRADGWYSTKPEPVKKILPEREGWLEKQLTKPDKDVRVSVPKQPKAEAPKPVFEGNAPEGAKVGKFTKKAGRWYRVDEEGNLGKIPTNKKQHDQLEADFLAPPKAEDTRPPLEILNKAKLVSVKLPEGATLLRAYDAKGRFVDVFIADANKGQNILRDAGITKIEAGFINREKKFTPIKGDIIVKERKPKEMALPEDGLENAITRANLEYDDHVAEHWEIPFGSKEELANAIRKLHEVFSSGNSTTLYIDQVGLSKSQIAFLRRAGVVEAQLNSPPFQVTPLFPVKWKRASKKSAAATKTLTDPELEKLFNETLAQVQRGRPETAMLRLQRTAGGGLLGYMAEHIGDLTHRMAETNTWSSAGYEFVKEKVDRAIRTLTNKYGFAREVGENIASNAKLRGLSPEQLWSEVDAALRTYAEEHRKLPVYNRMQKLARDAAVLIGLKEYNGAALNLFEIRDVLNKGVEEWVKEAHKYEPEKFTKQGATAEVVGEPDRLIAEAKGPQDFLKLLERPDLQLPDPEKALLREFFNRPTIQKLTGLRLAIVEAIKSGFVGDYDPQSRLSRFIAADSGVHETLHDLWYFLSPEDRMEFTQLRLREIAKSMQDLPRNYKEIAALERLAKEPLSSEEFIKAELPRWLYYLANEREFFVASMQHRFLREVFTPEAKGLVAKTKAMIQEVWDWLKTKVGIGDRRDALYRKILKGDYELSPEEGARLDAKEIEGALPRTPEEYKKQKAFDEKNVAGRTLAAYADIAKFKMEQADLLGLSPAARRMIQLPREAEMYAMAASELRGIENYYQARDAAPAESPHLRWGVIGDALHSLAYEEELARKLNDRYLKQQALVDSDSFQKKIAREAELAMRENVATAKEDTFRNVITQKIAVLEAQLRESGPESARAATLREDLRLARGLQEYAMAIGQQMDNIVNRVYPEFTRFGRAGYWTRFRENATGPKNGDEFLRLYQSARRAEGNPLENAQELALARLAAEILGINYDLTNRLLWAERWRREPDFQQAVKDLGATFVKRLREDPAAAIRWMVTREGKLATKAEQAKEAYLAINRDVMRELERLGDLEQAASAMKRIRESDPWKQLVNTVFADAEALHLPDVVVKAIKEGKYNTMFNEFTGRMVKVDPKGNWHEIDLEWTPENALKSQEKLDKYLGQVDDWLNDPANENSPDFQYWQEQKDWLYATYKTASVFAPRNVKSLLIHTALRMPEFWFKQAKLPAAKVAQTAAENWERSFDSGKQWSQGVEQPIIRLAQSAARKHGVDVSLGLQAYREKIFNSLAWAYRHGIPVKPGDKLYGVTVLTEDINLLRAMGRAVNDLITRQKNLGRERVMEPERLVDDYFKNAFLIRRPQEFGAEKGTTVPREFSSKAKMLARRIVGETIAPDGKRIVKPVSLDRAMEVFDWESYFEPFVMRWLAERSADYSKVTPFEGLFKEIVKLYNEKSPDAPRSVEEIIDFIDRNTDEATTKDNIKQIVVGGMVDELTSFYNKFLKDEGAKALTIRVLRATSQGPFNKAFEHDVGSSFYYDYGMLSGQEVRSMALDAGMYHLERFEIALHDLERVYNEAMLEFDETKGNPAARALLKAKNKALFTSGDDFRDFSVLRDQRAELRYFLENLPIWSGRGVAQYEGMQTMYRLVGDSVLSTLAGWKTLARVLSGSVVKQGFVFGAFERFYYTAYLKAALNMALSAMQIGVKGPLMFAARRMGLAPRLDTQFSGWAEEIFRNGKYFDQQYAYGLGTKTPVLDTVFNNLVMPYTHGRGYDPRLSGNAGLRLLQKGAYKALAAFEAPLEVIKTIFPTLGYSIAYDSVARQMYWSIKTLEAQARRSFEAHERAGTLGKFDLKDPRNPKNLLPAEEILPRGIFKRTQTQLDLVGEYFKRGTDADINDFVMEFWKKLSETPKEQRGNIHLLSADAKTPEEAVRLERNRAGALAAIGLFDIHHASPMNRMWALRASTVGRLAFPIAGWTLQSTRQWFALFGQSAHDPQMRKNLLTAMTALTVLAGMSAMAVGGDTEKRMFEKLEWIINRKVDPVRHFGQGRTTKENALIALHDVIAYITVLANLFDQVLGQKGNRSSAVDQIYVYAKLKSLAQYISGVIHSKDPTYGLSSFVVREAPSLKPLLNRLPANEGTVNLANVRTAIQRYAPEELLRKSEGGYGLPTATELSPIKQRLQNAIYKGDSEGVAVEYDNLKRKAVELGRTEPLRLAADIMRSLNPYTLALVGHPTDIQRQELLSKLNEHERQIVLDGESQYLAAAQLVGVQSQMTREQRGVGGTGATAGYTPSSGSAGAGSAVAVGTAGGGGAGGGSLLRVGGGGGGIGMPRRISLGAGTRRIGIRRGFRLPAVGGRIRSAGVKAARKRYVTGRLKARSGLRKGRRSIVVAMPKRRITLRA